MAAKHALLILTPGMLGSTIEVDGKQLAGIRGFTLTGQAMEMGKLTLDLVVKEANIDGEVLVSIPDKTKATLIALGWTPPDDETGDWKPVSVASGEPEELLHLTAEMRRLVHAVDKMRDQWAEAREARRKELWRGVHEACDRVWNPENK